MVVTPKPANEKASGQAIVLPCRDGFCKAEFASAPESAFVQGMHKGAAAPLVGGAAFFAAWGEPARPGLPPEGETGKGEINFLAAAG